MTDFYNFKIDNIKNLSLEEKNLRKKDLDLFFQNGFPNKKMKIGNLQILTLF